MIEVKLSKNTAQFLIKTCEEQLKIWEEHYNQVKDIPEKEGKFGEITANMKNKALNNVEFFRNAKEELQGRR